MKPKSAIPNLATTCPTLFARTLGTIDKHYFVSNLDNCIWAIARAGRWNEKAARLMNPYVTCRLSDLASIADWFQIGVVDSNDR